MELKKARAGMYEFQFNPLSTEVFVNESNEEWEVEIYKFRHFQGSLEITKDGKILIVEDLDLKLEQVNEYLIEIK
jgi:hypothetical protein